MKRINWTFIILVLIGFVIGRFLGTYFEDSWLNYGQTFGFSDPLEVDLGFLVFVIGFQIRITIASVIGVILSLVIYKFVK